MKYNSNQKKQMSSKVINALDENQSGPAQLRIFKPHSKILEHATSMPVDYINTKARKMPSHGHSLDQSFNNSKHTSPVPVLDYSRPRVLARKESQETLNSRASRKSNFMN